MRMQKRVPFGFPSIVKGKKPSGRSPGGSLRPHMSKEPNHLGGTMALPWKKKRHTVAWENKRFRHTLCRMGDYSMVRKITLFEMIVQRFCPGVA